MYYCAQWPTVTERAVFLRNDVVVLVFKDTRRGEPSIPLALAFQSHMTRMPPLLLSLWFLMIWVVLTDTYGRCVCCCRDWPWQDVSRPDILQVRFINLAMHIFNKHTFRVNIGRKRGISECEPVLPDPPVFAEGAAFHEFLLTKRTYSIPPLSSFLNFSGL